MNNVIHVLRDVGKKVLEEWGLMLVEESTKEECIFIPEEPLYLSSMHFYGIINGTIYIAAQKIFMEAITRNLLGIELNESVKTEDSEDAFREMSNVVLGNFLTEAYGEDTPFILKNPKIVKHDGIEALYKLPTSIIYYYLADSTPVAITFTIDTE